MSAGAIAASASSRRSRGHQSDLNDSDPARCMFNRERMSSMSAGESARSAPNGYAVNRKINLRGIRRAGRMFSDALWRKSRTLRPVTFSSVMAPRLTGMMFVSRRSPRCESESATSVPSNQSVTQASRSGDCSGRLATKPAFAQSPELGAQNPALNAPPPWTKTAAAKNRKSSVRRESRQPE